MTLEAQNEARESGSRRTWLLWLAVASLPLMGFWLYGLFDLDEGFYAAVTSAMLRSGDWITPHYNGTPWFEKPILLYWFSAPSVAAFGESVGPRLPSVLATIGLVALCGGFVRRHFGEGSGRAAMVVLGTSLITALVGRMMLVDPLLVFFFAAAMLCWWRSLRDCGRWRLLAGACLGAAVLAKGPVAILLFGGIWLWTLLAEKELRPSILNWVDNLGAFVVMAAVIALWYWPCWMVNGDRFVQDFLIAQNIGRFTGGDQAHKVPIWSHPIYFPVVLAVGMLPWWPFVVRRVRPAQEAADASQDEVERFLWRWFWVVLVFFSISGSKLPHYIYPAVPALGMVLGTRLAGKKPSVFISRPAFGVVFMALMLAVVATSAGLGYYRSSGQAEVHSLATRARSLGGDVVAFQMGRRTKDRGTGKLKVMETSLPSLEFYVNRVVPQVEDFALVLKNPQPSLILTRVGRIGEPELIQVGVAGRNIWCKERGDKYELWELK
ncbi:MAG: glycosyltransferase family 39 protein [Armatimonadetes bacterium]|nr:glycosyltransferase family 39 protein [Armatimonadota bacterium]